MATIYVETSVWSHAFAEDAPDKRAETLRFLGAAKPRGHRLFISPVLLDEFSDAQENLKGKLLGLVRSHSPALLELGDEAIDLAQRFLDFRAIPPSKVQDARHVAVAVVNQLDALVSWNYEHLVNVRRREALGHIAALCGYYKPLHIIAPPEVNYARE